MDREAAVLRAEMSRTREQLDQKLTLLQEQGQRLDAAAARAALHARVFRRSSARRHPDAHRAQDGVVSIQGHEEHEVISHKDHQEHEELPL